MLLDTALPSPGRTLLGATALRNVSSYPNPHLSSLVVVTFTNATALSGTPGTPGTHACPASYLSVGFREDFTLIANHTKRCGPYPSGPEGRNATQWKPRNSITAI